MAEAQKVISNLGIDVSSRYAKDQANIHGLFKGGSTGAPSEIVSTTPSYASEFDQLFNISSARSTWANMSPPKNFSSSSNSVLSNEFIPSLGSQEKTNQAIETLESLPKSNTILSKEDEKRRTDLLDFFKTKDEKASTFEEIKNALLMKKI